LNLFKDIIPSLTTGRVPVCQTEEDFKQYPAYQVNAALSYYQDCIFFVNEMNMKSFLTNEMQHDFYFLGYASIRGRFLANGPRKHNLMILMHRL
jgi:hypothetical protein